METLVTLLTFNLPFSPLDIAGKERAKVSEAPVDVVDVGKTLVLHLTVGVVL